ncbi:hypothetical protein NW755_003748 [Fusarium falciforme]|uniref:DNA-binding protein RAP1 n=1 Tax=Fusarium falciforme TaxID=195108 RepID=A0A9W8RAB6_9HYPO|nr:hypothetical protein NW755_003748 [Fusarium falciforme]
MGTTYNGVNGAQGGNIFKDVKFWVAQRVPLRSTWIDDIKQNGGIVVPLEKHADMLIADHKRLDAPPGSYSWKFIEDSVRNGIIQIKDKYRIGPDPDLPRPVGAKHGAKTTRTPFTKDDDANLARWVLSQRSQQQQGNAIYQQYEAINPRHTWQSWRDRFVKRLQPRGMAALERLAAEAPEADVSEPAVPPELSPRPATEKRQTARQSEPQAARVLGEPQDARRSEPQSIQRPRPQPNTVPESAPERSQSQTRPASVLSQDDPTRQIFYEDLNDFKTTSKADIKERLNINGRTIDLFDLAMAVDASQVDSQMYDWYLVAEKLGFDDPDEDTATQLQVCYDEHLSEFVAAMATFELEDEDNVELEAEGPEEGPFEQDVPEQASSQWPASYVPSSPPVVIGRKRSAGQRQLSAGHGTKRPRYDKDMVIPSTPDAGLDAELPAVENSPSARKSSQWRGYVDEKSTSSNRREIQKWTTYYENRGFPRDIVVEALKRTTLTPGNLALQVMESLQAGRGVPSRHEGIWTDRDDDDLAFVSMVDFSQSPTNTSEELQQQRAQKAHNRLIRKHTFQRFELRKAFLRAQANQGHSKE